MGYHDAILDTLTLYNYDKTIFEEFSLPDGMDKENVVDTILLETTGLSVIYPSPTALKQTIGIWTRKNFNVWSELYSTLHYEYNPIHNYDRTEYGRDILDGKEKETRDLKNVDDYERDLKDESDTRNKIAAFNNGLADSEQSHGTIDYTGKSKDTKTDTGTVDNKTDNTTDHYFRAYGNIGVTTTQAMIKEQREIVQFNLTDYIVSDYKKHFCVAVY